MSASAISWRPTGPSQCGACLKTVYPHQNPVIEGDVAYHIDCAPATPTGIGAVENPAEIARAHRQAREDAIRFDLKLAMDPGSGEFHRESLRRLQQTVPETFSI